MDYPPKSNHVSSKWYISLYLWQPIFYFEFGSFPHLCSSQQFILSFGRFSIVSMGEKKKRWISFCPWFGAKHEKNQILSCNISLYYFEFFSKVALENSHFLIEPIFFCTLTRMWVVRRIMQLCNLRKKGTNRSHRSNDNGNPFFVTHKYSIHCNFVSELDMTFDSSLNSSENIQLPTPIGKPQKDGYPWSSRGRWYHNFSLECSRSPSFYQRPQWNGTIDHLQYEYHSANRLWSISNIYLPHLVLCTANTQLV